MDTLQVLRKYRKYILIILILFVGYYLLFARKVTCEDKVCFEQKMENCAGAKFYYYENSGAVTLYKVENNPFGTNYCVVNVKMLQPGEISEQYKEIFTNAEMRCRIPIINLVKPTLASIVQNIDYCHGTLKEAMYKAMINSLYKLMARDIGTVITEVNRKLG